MKSIAVSLIRGLMVLLSRLPLKLHYFMGDVISWLAMNVFHYRTGVVWKNISRSFPDMKYRELRKVYKAFYKHFGEIFAEAVWFGGSSYKRLHDNGIVTVMNPEDISAIYEASPSVTILSTHCGNWELLGGLLGYRTATGGRISFPEKAISVVYKKLKNDVWDRVFALNRIAPLTEVGTECEVESANILRFAVRNRNEKRVYIYPTDQAPYYKSGPHPIGMFMHQETKAMIGSVGVACMLSHAVVYMKMKRVERGRYEMSFIPICPDASAMKPEQIMRRYYDLLEEELNETPHNWLWTHNRWK